MTPGDNQDDGQVEHFVSLVGEVLPDWVDVNDHMNVSFYDRVFDAAEKTLFDALTLDETYAVRTGFGIFRLEKTIRYERELRLGHRFEVRSCILFTDDRLIHHVHELVNLTVPARAAFNDCLSIHVDLTRRKSAAIGFAEVLNPLHALLKQSEGRPPPQGVVPRDFSKGRNR